jgi:carbonic anhydrase
VRLLLPVAVAIASCGAPARDQPPHASGGDHVTHWTYAGVDGPERWASLDPTFSACGAGTSQTPIDLPAQAPTAPLPELKFSYVATPLVIVNNGHTIQATATSQSTLIVGEKTYGLRQFHAHAPSEHTIAGKHADLELHLVHADASGALAVATNRPLQPLGSRQVTSHSHTPP